MFLAIQKQLSVDQQVHIQHMLQAGILLWLMFFIGCFGVKDKQKRKHGFTMKNQGCGSL
jgi:hypothetical protein